ncbi:PqqD family protein [Zhihengliuella flava]|uniref:PqqD family protein n=1 Tax=Zhihengliuella flava TaxID=1285193 RepID=A0A931DBQ9_9MICC|nr:PqqD family protein [Zhihengliuella flava]MBG6083948.1 hypothetical protein [Zhihengliuella flava]
MDSLTHPGAVRWRRAEHVAEVSTAANRVAVLPLDADVHVPYLLTGTAAAIWSETQRAATAEQIVTALAPQYEVPADEIREHVGSFLRQLEACHLVIATTESG